MMRLRTNLWRMMLYVVYLVVLLGFPCSYAAPNGDNVQDSPVCDPKCGCDGMYIYDEIKEDCVVNLPKLMKKVLVHYDNQDHDDILAKDGMERSIYIEGQKIFQGILISVMLFMVCAGICVVSACVYCCRINYTDHKLKKDVKALAKKMHRDIQRKKESVKPKTEEPKSQSCNVMVEEAGVFVV